MTDNTPEQTDGRGCCVRRIGAAAPARVRHAATRIAALGAFACLVVACGNGGESSTETDGCGGAGCLTPPPGVCEGDTLVQYIGQGACVAGTCFFESDDTACEHGCVDGLCAQ